MTAWSLDLQIRSIFRFISFCYSMAAYSACEFIWTIPLFLTPQKIGLLNTVLPRFTQLPWQIKNRVNQNSHYTSHSMDKIIVKKMSKKFL